MRIGLVSVVLLLAACKPAIPSPAPETLEHSKTPPAAVAASSQPTAARSSDFSGDFDIAGTEPFWSIRLRGGKALTLTRPDAPPVEATAPGAVIQPGQATWNATTSAGALLVLKLSTGDCSDGMSDRSYPMAAEVQFEGRTLIGCAAKTGAAAVTR